MGVLNLRKVDDGLLEELKVKSVRSGKSLREFCIEALKRAVGTIPVEVEKSEEKLLEPKKTPTVRLATPVKPPSQDKVVMVSKGPPDCPDCGETMADWKTQWRCNKCKKFHDK